MEKKKIIIDTDIGDDIDDAYALSYLIKERATELLGVTTVYRNSLQRAKIVSALLHTLNETHVKVYAGNDYPYKSSFTVEKFEKVLPDGRPVIPHYDDTLASFPVEEKGAAEFIAETAERYPGEVTLLAIGPLTNLADVARKYPSSYKKLKGVVCMGGCFAAKKAEWNIRCDPEGAAIAAAGGALFRYIGVDITIRTSLDKAETERLMQIRSPETPLLTKMLQKWIDTHPGRKPTMHDVLAAAELTESFCGYAEGKIAVALEGAEKGMTVERQDGGDAAYAVSFNREAFMQRFFRVMETDGAADAATVKNAG